MALTTSADALSLSSIPEYGRVVDEMRGTIVIWMLEWRWGVTLCQFAGFSCCKLASRMNKSILSPSHCSKFVFVLVK